MRTRIIRPVCWAAALVGAYVLLDLSGITGHTVSNRRPENPAKCNDGICLSSPHNFGRYQTDRSRWQGDGNRRIPFGEVPDQETAPDATPDCDTLKCPPEGKSTLLGVGTIQTANRFPLGLSSLR